MQLQVILYYGTEPMQQVEQAVQMQILLLHLLLEQAIIMLVKNNLNLFMSNQIYYDKYTKYKVKYENLKIELNNQKGGDRLIDRIKN